MHISELSGKNVCVLGYGKEGRAMVEALEKYAPGCEITVADKNPDAKMEDGRWKMEAGPHYLDHLDQFDIIIKSPGIPPNSRLEALSPPLARFASGYSKLTTPTQIFFDSIADSGARVIGVTGSKGKSTTSTLIHSILSAQSSKLTAQSYLIGNIGEPAIGYIERAKKNTIFVHEMSSYQLMDLTVSPSIAVVTAFFPEHLDYHGSLEAYLEAKKHIARFQGKNDIIFFNGSSPQCAEIASESKGRQIPFSIDESPVTLDDILLKGTHNLGNIAAAYKVALHLGCDVQTTIDVIKKFRGLPHRLQSLGVHHSVEWIDDSISTTPESAIAALSALGDRVSTIIVGGQDRGYDFTELAATLKNSGVKTVILLPDSGKTIGKAIEKTKANIECIEVKTIEEAVTVAAQKTQSSKLKAQSSAIVLLSPAAPSYGHFKNFEERGERFKTAILSL